MGGGAGRPRARAGLLALGLVTLVLTRIAPADATALTAQPGDGTTAATAAASCWGIKQAHPTSPSGVYWLQTPALDRPGQYYCDQATAGGGWVLIGRGRENW